MLAQPDKLSRFLFVGCIVLAIIAIYSFPIMATAHATRTVAVPSVFGPDLSLYLNLSNLQSAVDGEPINPYYGITTRFEGFGHLVFRLAFQVFGVMSNLFAGNLWATVFVWNAVCWVAICGAGFWFFEETLPKGPLPIHALGIGLLMLFNFGALKSLAMAWVALPSLVAFENVNLPYMRSFFPQVGVVWLLLYLALQVRALRSWRWATWAWMFVVQGLAFAMFPYATVMMAGTTLVAVVFLSFRGSSLNWRIVILFALSCGAADLAYCLRNWHVQSGYLSAALIEFQPDVIIANLASGTVILLAALTVLAALLPATGSREAKWTVAGLGACNTVMLFGDAVFSSALMVSVHAAYFVHCTIAIEVTFLAGAFYVRFGRVFYWTRWVSAATIAILFANGGILAFTTYRQFLPTNREIVSLAEALKFLNPQAGDLVIVRSRVADDPCEWVPLLTPATVLFCRNSQFALTMEQQHTLYRVRQAFYLYFTRRDSRWVEEIMKSQQADGMQNLAFLREISTNGENIRKQAIASINAELIPLLSDVEEHAAEVRFFFHAYKRVLVIDDVEHPIFSWERLVEYLILGKEDQIGPFSVYWCKPALRFE